MPRNTLTAIDPGTIPIAGSPYLSFEAALKLVNALGIEIPTATKRNPVVEGFIYKTQPNKLANSSMR